MFIRQLSLRDYRSWAELSLSLQPGISIFVGRNGYGKTNIVEAIGYLAHLGSHRVSQDAPLVRQGCDSARISATVINQGRELSAHMLIKAQGRNLAQLNRTKLQSPKELLGVVQTTLFSPEDLALVRGEPEQRRRYLDAIIASQSPRLAGVRQEYEKVLRQRNSLLKKAGFQLRQGYGSAQGEAALATLDAWDEQLARLGSEVIVARHRMTSALVDLVHDSYARIAPESRPASIRYKSSVDCEPGQDTQVVEAAMLSGLATKRQAEIERGTTLVGPHRDDVEVLLGQYPAKGFASHGETWSMALSLRLAEFYYLKSQGNVPILILDDVFAELDAKRREQLVAITTEAEQVLITAAVDGDLPANLEEGEVHRFYVDVEQRDGARISCMVEPS